jgi:endonuclease V-like protein UPF0215 family
MSRDDFRNIRVVGVEDGSFQKGVTRRTILTAVLLQRLEIEDVRTTKITVDGLDATEKLMEILREWEFGAVVLAGVSFAGFNLIDPAAIHKTFRKPVIIISRSKPNNKAIKRALQRHFKDWRIRWAVFGKLGSIHQIGSSAFEPPIYVENFGTHLEWVSELVRALSICSRVPEPVRIARLIARGLS